MFQLDSHQFAFEVQINKSYVFWDMLLWIGWDSWLFNLASSLPFMGRIPFSGHEDEVI